MTGCPPFLLDLFLRHVKPYAESRGLRFGAVYSDWTTSTWDFPATPAEAAARLRAQAQLGRQVVVFRHDRSGWHILASANVPARPLLTETSPC